MRSEFPDSNHRPSKNKFLTSPFWPADSPVQIAPDFERLNAALFCRQPDRVPLLELFHDLEVKEAFIGKPIRGAVDDIRFHWNAGYDYYTFGFQYQEIVTAYSRIHNLSSGSASPLYGRVAPRNWVSESSGLITNRKDFDNFPWPDPGRSPVMAMANVFDRVTGEQAVQEALACLPDGMKLILQTDGIFERFTKLMGLEKLSYMIFDDPPLVEEMFQVGGRLAVELFETMARQPGVGALWLADDLAYGSGPLISPQIMRKFLFPWYRIIAEIARSSGYPLIFHSDGNLLSILPDLVDIGFNAIHPVEPNAMDIGCLKETYGRRLCLIGNIDLGSTLTLGSPQAVREEVHQRIRQVAHQGGYCLGSSNTVTNYVPLENFKAMVEATFEFGKYPSGG
jgi:uroporphyrinogen decarboxylase